MACTRVTRAKVDAMWAALWQRGYDSYTLAEALAEAALEELAAGESIEDAISYAERRYGVRPRSTWCPECQRGDTECCYTPGVCSDCGSDLEDT